MCMSLAVRRMGGTNICFMEDLQCSLMLTGDAFKKIIITKEVPAPYYNDSGVLVISIYDFLLNVNSLEQ